MKTLFLLLSAFTSLVWPALAVTGDTQCQKAMCVTAINHNNATTSYDLTVSEAQVGWMAVGFGRSMIAAPLVILWQDTTTGDTIVSQRAASDFVMPTVVSNPNPVATALSYRATSNSSALSLSFSVPSTTETRQNLIWAWCRTPPSGNTVDATIVQHDDEGLMLLNMANPLPDSLDGPSVSGSTPQPTATPVASYGNDDEIALTYSQKVFLAHAVFLTIAFIVILPLGALQARLLRTIVPGKWWFGAHWILQWPVSTVLIIIGFALGVVQSHRLSGVERESAHKKAGFVLVGLYVAQCALGGFIHFVKPKGNPKRPPQNYGHAILGIFIIALSFWQVYTGMDSEWPAVGGPTVPMGYWTWWKAWIIIIPCLYVFGLALLPRQYRLEEKQRQPRRNSIKTSALRLQDRYKAEP